MSAQTPDPVLLGNFLAAVRDWDIQEELKKRSAVHSTPTAVSDQLVEGGEMKSLRDTTVKQVLPYKFIATKDGWITILNLSGEEVVHHVGEMQWQLENNPNLLDVHTRKMYQGALEYWQAR